MCTPSLESSGTLARLLFNRESRPQSLLQATGARSNLIIVWALFFLF